MTKELYSPIHPGEILQAGFGDSLDSIQPLQTA